MFEGWHPPPSVRQRHPAVRIKAEMQRANQASLT
jgi:hypothetical protein